MTSYWIVVPRGNEELFELLCVAFQGRTGFSVIEDRRTLGTAGPGEERRSNAAPLGPDEIVIAERADAAPALEGRGSRRVLAGRPRYVRSGSRRIRSGAPLAMGLSQRLLTL